LGLSNLCWIYDNNHITIEGHTGLAFSEDVAGRFLAYGWNVERVSNANGLPQKRWTRRAQRGCWVSLDWDFGFESDD
ncbi:MAG TPA: hypothetical protein VIS99_03125, partial [Terrimicrobiaceae bacterium]